MQNWNKWKLATMILFILLIAESWYLVYKSKSKEVSVNQSLVNRIISDSLKFERIEHEKDSIVFADSVYFHKLGTMPKASLESEFHKAFSR